MNSCPCPFVGREPYAWSCPRHAGLHAWKSLSSPNRAQAEGGEWKEELLFVVPREHEEMMRLENRYQK